MGNAFLVIRARESLTVAVTTASFVGSSVFPTARERSQGGRGFSIPSLAPRRVAAPREKPDCIDPVGVVWAPSALAAAANALKQFAAATKTVAAEAGTHVV